MKILVQRSTDGLLLTPQGGWTAEKDQARAFQHCTEAIDFCVDQALTDVRLWLSFENSKYDFPMEVFRTETRVLVKYNKELREKGRALLIQNGPGAGEGKGTQKVVSLSANAGGRRVGDYSTGASTVMGTLTSIRVPFPGAESKEK